MPNDSNPRSAIATLLDGKWTRADVLAVLALLAWLVPLALAYLPESTDAPAEPEAPADTD